MASNRAHAKDERLRSEEREREEREWREGDRQREEKQWGPSEGGETVWTDRVGRERRGRLQWGRERKKRRMEKIWGKPEGAEKDERNEMRIEFGGENECNTQVFDKELL